MPLLATLLITPSAGAHGQDLSGFFKFSTLYASVNIASPFVAADQYAVGFDRENTGLTTNNYSFKTNYNFVVGIRKLARFDYEKKNKNFYDGTESSSNESATIGAVSGWEYLFKYSQVREFGEEFYDSQAFMRYIGDQLIVKGEYRNNGLVDLQYTQLSMRLKKDVNGFQVSAGASYRNHPVYGVDPFYDWMVENNDEWWNLAYDYDYYDIFWWYDGNQNGEYDPEEYFTNIWVDADDVPIAYSDREFLGYTFDGVISDYNTSQIKSLGLQGELSAVLGVDYYKFAEDWWMHGWVSVFPYHRGLSDFSYDYDDSEESKGSSVPLWLEWDAGAIVGYKMTENLGLFVEGTDLRYWNIHSYEYKAGINYTIF